MPVDAFKPQDGITGTNSSDMDVGEINLADMNPEDIRVSLHSISSIQSEYICKIHYCYIKPLQEIGVNPGYFSQNNFYRSDFQYSETSQLSFPTSMHAGMNY
jgi:hypothetical protein